MTPPEKEKAETMMQVDDAGGDAKKIEEEAENQIELAIATAGVKETNDALMEEEKEEEEDTIPSLKAKLRKAIDERNELRTENAKLLAKIQEYESLKTTASQPPATQTLPASQPLIHLNKGRASGPRKVAASVSGARPLSVTSVGSIGSNSSAARPVSISEDIVVAPPSTSDTQPTSEEGSSETKRASIVKITQMGGQVNPFGAGFDPSKIKLGSFNRNRAQTTISSPRSANAEGGMPIPAGPASLRTSVASPPAFSIPVISSDEISAWIAESLPAEEKPATSNLGDMEAYLKDGVILVKLLNALKLPSTSAAGGGEIKFKSGKFAFFHKENVDNFLKECSLAGVDKRFLFSVNDIIEGSNLALVLVTLNELKRISQPATASAAPDITPTAATSSAI